MEEVPFGSDHRTLAWLRDLKAKVEDIETKVGRTSDTSAGEDPDETVTGAFNPVPDTEASLASSGAASAEDAWTTVTPAAPAGARYALIRFQLWSNAASDVGYLQWRTENGAVESPRVSELVNTFQKAPGDFAFLWVTLSAAGTFQYKMTNTSASVQDWDVTYCGYSL